MKFMKLFFALSCFILIGTTNTKAQCNAFSFDNYMTCPVTIHIEVHCGTDLYVYDGVIGAALTPGSPTSGLITFNSSASIGIPTSCDFSNCEVYFSLNGSSAIDMNQVGGQVSFCCSGFTCTTAGGCMLVEFNGSQFITLSGDC